jgi:hypothetical protein
LLCGRGGNGSVGNVEMGCWSGLLRCSEFEPGSQRLWGVSLPLSLVGHVLDAILCHFFQKGEASPEVIYVQLCVEGTLLGLKQFHSKLVQRTCSLLLGSRGVM